MNKAVKIFDSYLRDGAQARNVSFSIEDKIKILKALDEIGVAYVEAGNPGSNIKDKEFFERIKGMTLKNTKLAAFGSTRRKGIEASEDENVLMLLSAETEIVVIFGKSWDFQVTDVIQTTLDENLGMIKDTVKFFKDKGKEVIYDAEHFFDGYRSNSKYALRTLQAAKDGGADCLVLCDTNGGGFPDDIYETTKLVVEKFGMEIGIHCHNDTGMAEANSIMAVKAGATHVQGTFIGIGERCGNANLATIIANLQIKKNIKCIPKEQLANLTDTARYLAEITNMRLNPSMPYVGNNAFAHKGGMHIDGVTKASKSFEHITPELVGNHRTFLMSEVSGKNAIMKMLQKVDGSITKGSKEAKELVNILKEMENEGYQFEAAETSFEMLVRKHLGKYKPYFKVLYYRIIEEDPESSKELSASAMIKIMVDGQEEITASEGNGPVNALDKALRKAIEVFYPNLKEMKLVDYKVRVIDSGASASKVRVLIESSDGASNWTTVGVSTNIIEASMLALMDSVEYKLLKDEENK
ncbi:MAG: citramalate synthase [Eubacteriales bacterium]